MGNGARRRPTRNEPRLGSTSGMAPFGDNLIGLGILRKCIMAPPNRERFATQVDSEILTAIRTIAEVEGRGLETLVEEALSDLIEKRKQERPRSHVMAAYDASHEKFARLYKKLAE
jgi:hypothetical protein